MLAGPAATPGEAARIAVPANDVLVVGDSLAVGMLPYLGDRLPERDITWSVRNGITSPEGLTRVRSALLVGRPRVVVISVGTNDGSDGRAFKSRMRAIMAEIGRGTCVIWSTVHRAPRKGAFRAINTVLRRQAKRDDRIVLLDWAKLVVRRAVVLPDGVHPDAPGYVVRSDMVASAVRDRC